MKNLLNISDLTSSEFHQILSYADELNKNFDNCLLGKNIGLIFEKKLYPHSTILSSWY